MSFDEITGKKRMFRLCCGSCVMIIQHIDDGIIDYDSGGTYFAHEWDVFHDMFCTTFSEFGMNLKPQPRIIWL